jgi:hypothetical protein
MLEKSVQAKYLKAKEMVVKGKNENENIDKLMNKDIRSLGPNMI